MTPSQRKRFKFVRAGDYHPKFKSYEKGKYWEQHVQNMIQVLDGSSLKVHNHPNDNINTIDWNKGEYISVNSFLGTMPYMSVIGGSKIMVFTYPDPEQDTSGTLADAMGWGRAITSTDFAFAREMIGVSKERKRGVMNIGDRAARGLLTHCGKQSVKETAQALDYWLISKEGQELLPHYEYNAHQRGHETRWSNSAWKMIKHADYLHTEKNITRGRGNKHMRIKKKPAFARYNPD